MPLDRNQLVSLGPASRSVHAGQHVDTGNAKPTVPPLHLATAYSYPTTEELDEVFADNSRGYVYARMDNPTVRSLEEAIAIIEGTEAGVAYASGMAAIHAVLRALVPSGRTMVAARDIYGTTLALLHGQLAEVGIVTIQLDSADLEAFARGVEEARPAVVYLESISNPLVKVADVAAIARIAHEAGALLVLDNTFASPVVTLGQPLGADVIIYSSTKHLAGHGDSTGGIVATSGAIAQRLRDRRKISGAVLSPFDAWLTLRGIRTMHLRVRQQCANASAIAAWLSHRPGIDQVFYPKHDIPVADGQFQTGLYGSMLAFDIAAANRDDAFRFLDALRLIEPATTLGDVQSLVLHPATTSHRPLTAEQRTELGIGDGLIRFSAGIEDVFDLIADLDTALVTIGR